jgi:polyhydroxyalkanoate synthesis regulator phasin
MPQPKSSRSSGSTSRSSSARKQAAKKKPAAAKKPSTTAKKSQAKPRAKRTTQPKRDDSTLNQLREALSDGLVLTTRRVQEALDEAVRGGHMTRRSAEDLARELIEAGRKQTQDLMSEIESLLGKARPDLSSARSLVRDGSDRAMREVDRVRRTAGIGPVFPILGYDDLTAGQVQSRLGDLSSAELRKVRDHERRNANRKSVLAAIEKALR